MNLKSRAFISALILCSLLALSGCVSRNDLEGVQRDTDNTTRELLVLQRNLYDLSTEMKTLSSNMEALGRKADDLRQKMNGLDSETKAKIGFLEKEMEIASQPMRRYQADLGARLDKLQMDVQNLMGRFEESKYFAQKTFEETKVLKESYQGKLNEIDKRIVALNKSMDAWEKKLEAKATEAEQEAEEEKPSAKVEPAKAQPPPKKPEKPEKKAVGGPEEAYKKAYNLFTQGDIEGAKQDFRKFLEVYPKAKYAENAHFWLGECYFAEKKYDEAILEFDEMIKKYPKGNKVPDALFRQGMAFLEMKDTVNAKLIFKEVIKRFPKSDQANRARKKLKEV